MPAPHQYDRSSTPDLRFEDYDSEGDLDLEELDPTTASNAFLRQNGRVDRLGFPGRKGGEAIALRQMRSGRVGGPYGRSRRPPTSERGPIEETGDLQGLLESEDGGSKRDGRGNAKLVDQDLHRGHSTVPRQARQADDDGDRSHLGTMLRRLNFMSAVAGAAKPSEGQQEGDGDEQEHDPTTARHIQVGQQQPVRFPANSVSNAKYTPWSFLPRTLYKEFSFFFNLYFLLVALSQIIPALRIGYLSTYVAPLVFVLTITLGKEAADDIARRKRDAESNAEAYTVIRFHDLTDCPRKERRRWSSVAHPKFTRRKRMADDARDRQTAIEEEEENLIGHGEGKKSSIEFSEVSKKAKDLKVGDVLKLGRDQRVPADVVILKSYTSESSVEPALAANNTHPTADTDIVDDTLEFQSQDTVALRGSAERGAELGAELEMPVASNDTAAVGETFIRTDQLDGETDWKLRLASPLSQSLTLAGFPKLRVIAGKPDKKVNEFVGTIELIPDSLGAGTHQTTRHKKTTETNHESSNNHEDVSGAGIKSAPLSIENTAWANTVLASACTTLAVVVYTGPQTRQALSTAPSRSKTGLLDMEINNLTKILCALTLTISIILVALEGFERQGDQKWYIAMTRFLILFSTIIPISLRVNLDMGKTVYARFIERDQDIPGTVVRTSTIPEELGRIEYLLSDKTGTLTQNDMELKKIHVGTVSYANEAMEEVATYVRQALSIVSANRNEPAMLVTPSSAYNTPSTTGATRSRREIGSRVRDLIMALALCHNVTPTSDEVDGQTVTTYQASSPDEIAIVRWIESVGLRLTHRDRRAITLSSIETGRIVVRVSILEVFPFTSETKRMGIIVRFHESLETPQHISEDGGPIWFYEKGADTVMSSIVAVNDWLDEETANMAREGLRTLVVGRRRLSTSNYQEFSACYKEASMALQGREFGMAKIVKSHLERDLELLGVTGVEDKLQQDIKPSLELLRNAGIKIWMLTGDKIETARCVAVSAKLVARGQYIHTIANLKRKELAQDSLDFLRNKPDACLLIDGESLSLMLTHFRDSFISLAVLLPTVVACRCSPTQKADVALLIRRHTKKRVCCIGDGGNDVSMIQAADIGVGIVGKEGRQASLAADFSITQFCHLTKLLVWHGRNSYKRSAKLAQFIIHRGLIISVCQTMFSIATDFEPHALYRDWLLVGYATVYTMAPVFSLVLDKDVDEELANLYPELYKELTTGQSLSYRTFFIWVLVSIYQGGIIQSLSEILVAVEGPRMVSVSFTVLVLNELIMVAFEITTWHPVMIFSLVGTGLVYFGSVAFLGAYFDLAYVLTWAFAWRVAAISAISLIPPYAVKVLRRTLKPPSYRKIQAL